LFTEIVFYGIKIKSLLLITTIFGKDTGLLLFRIRD